MNAIDTDKSFDGLLVRTPLSAPFWDGLQEGLLLMQRCGACGHHWLPARRECPHCLRDAASWVPATGLARLVSWVVYHTPLHPAFESQLPYNVAVVELQEGPRLVSNIVGVSPDQLRIDQPLRFTTRQRGSVQIAQFETISD